MLGVALASLMMLGARCEKNGPPPGTTDGPPPGTTGDPPGTTDGNTDVTAEIPKAIHADMQAVIADVYGGGELVDHRSNHLTGRTPVGIEVDQCRLTGLRDPSVEALGR